MKIILFANTDWFLYNFRRDLALTLLKEGNEVILVSPPGEYASRLQELGFRWISISLTRRGMNPLVELLSIMHLVRLYNKEKPAVVHHNTIKCVLYGSVAARLANVGVIVNSITGLGYIFLPGGLIKRLVRFFVRLWYRMVVKGTQVIFENSEDMQIFLNHKLIQAENCTLVRGAGVDAQRFALAPEPPGSPVVLLAARMLWDKGVGEFVDAARILRKSGMEARFAISGRVDPGNPTSISETQLTAWHQEGLLEWWGWQENIQAALAHAHIVCHPSYREGLPTILIEAAACGRPIVTTDTAGCRDAIVDGETGILVPVKDADALAGALRLLIADSALRQRMGMAGRKRAEAEFSVKRVVQDTLDVYRRAGLKGI